MANVRHSGTQKAVVCYYSQDDGDLPVNEIGDCSQSAITAGVALVALT